MLSVGNLNVSYGAFQAVCDASLDVRTGELVVLLGANGAGKTSILRAISGLVPIRGGSIAAEGVSAAMRIGKEEGMQQFNDSLHGFLKKAGFTKAEVEVVSREANEPHFETLLASGVKGGR